MLFMLDTPFLREYESQTASGYQESASALSIRRGEAVRGFSEDPIQPKSI